jgi:hypothetical protein
MCVERRAGCTCRLRYRMVTIVKYCTRCLCTVTMDGVGGSMRHSVRQAASALTLIACSLAALPAGAQDTAGCPKAGTVISAKNTTGLYNSTARGSDPKDASVCIGVSEGPGSGVNYGKEVRRVYAFMI